MFSKDNDIRIEYHDNSNTPRIIFSINRADTLQKIEVLNSLIEHGYKVTYIKSSRLGWLFNRELKVELEKKVSE